MSPKPFILAPVLSLIIGDFERSRRLKNRYAPPKFWRETVHVPVLIYLVQLSPLGAVPIVQDEIYIRTPRGRQTSVLVYTTLRRTCCRPISLWYKELQMNFYRTCSRIIEAIDSREGSLPNLLNSIEEQQRKRAAALILDSLKREPLPPERS